MQRLKTMRYTLLRRGAAHGLVPFCGDCPVGLDARWSTTS